MSEKRFEVDVDHLLLVWDTEKNKRLEIEDIVDLLNEQQATIYYLEEANPRLQEQLGETLALVDEQQATIQSLQSENIILKNKIEDLRVSLHFQDKELQRLLQQSKGSVKR